MDVDKRSATRSKEDAMTQPRPETMEQYRRAASTAADPHGIRRALRSVTSWIDRGQLGAGQDALELSRYTGSRF